MIVWRDVFLGVIAVATLAIAIAQIAVIVSAAAAVKRAGQLADQFEREVKPLFGHLNAIARDAARAAQLASVQVERDDKLFADLSVRLEETMNACSLRGGQRTAPGPRPPDPQRRRRRPVHLSARALHRSLPAPSAKP